jgi:hypothetical protein
MVVRRQLVVSAPPLGYSVGMIGKREAVILDRIIDPISRCLTPQVARRIVDLRADPEVQTLIERLAA